MENPHKSGIIAAPPSTLMIIFLAENKWPIKSKRAGLWAALNWDLINPRNNEGTQTKGPGLAELVSHFGSGISTGMGIHAPFPTSCIPNSSSSSGLALGISIPSSSGGPGSHGGLFPDSCPEQLSSRFIFSSQPWIGEWKFSDVLEWEKNRGVF